MTAQGRALSREKGAGFVARNWLENDGDGAEQDIAAGRWANVDQGRTRFVHLSGKRAMRAFSGCARGDIVVMNVEPEVRERANCLVLTPSDLRASGSVAIFGTEQSARLVTARDMAGDRMWSGWARYPRVTLALPAAPGQVALQMR